MGRLDHRLKRLEQRVKGSHATLWQARLARMTYDELMAAVVNDAVRYGMPQDQAHADPEAAATWLGAYLKTALETLSEQERDEAMAGPGLLRDRRI